jgi:hypothetical protein
MDALSRENELGFLKQQTEWLSAQLDAIGERIQELERTEE